jgi:DNA modification methylase
MKIRNRIRELRQVRAGDLTPNPKNWRTHPQAQQDALKGILAEIGYADALLARELDDGSLMLVDGHLRAETTPDQEVPVLVLDIDEAEAGKLLLSLDPLAALAETNAVALDALLREVDTGSEGLQQMYADMAEAADLYQSSNADNEGNEAEKTVKLADRFGVPPFSVLNAREGWWQDRKRAWLNLGIQSELGRNAAVGGSKMVAGYENGQRVTGLVAESDTSIFDPVLCELAYSWFSPPEGVVIDPFAGGSVRGVVASKLNRAYTGCELRAEQVESNNAQAPIAGEIEPQWINGDSRNIVSLCDGLKADFIFSCPPYADLERYSDDPADLSTLRYDEFVEAYREIIKETCSLLKKDRFACFVVGDVRDKAGRYYNFVGDTVEAFRDAGLHYYNEAILVTAVGSLPIRAGKQFAASRKLGKTHQNVLVFVKGDGKKAAAACGDCDFGATDQAEQFGEVLE